jgi:phage/plasmid-like protein (TIGR03299 family)
MYLIKNQFNPSEVSNLANVVQTTAREFMLHDVSDCEDVNEVMNHLNVGRYSKVDIPNVCKGYSVIKDDFGNPLSIVQDTYDLLQPQKAFAFMDSLREQVGFTYSKAGFLQNGRQLFIQGKLGDFEVPTTSDRRKGDILNKIITAKTSFDGSMATTIAIEILRVWCDNGCASWENDSVIGKVKHTKTQDVRMARALSHATGLRQVVQDLENDISTLSNVQMTGEQFEQVATRVFAGDSTRSENQRDAVKTQFANERLGAFGSTAWDAMNAFTAWATHERTSRNTEQTTREENHFRAQSDSAFPRKVRKAIQEVMAV